MEGLPFIFLFLLLILAAPLSTASQAQPVYAYDAFHSRFQVRPDGTLVVQHRVTYRFENPSGWVGLNVPASMGSVLNARVLDGSGEPLPGDLWDLRQDERGTVLWFNCSSSAGITTVVYEFNMSGALRLEGDRVYLYWTGVPAERTSSIPESSVTLELPQPVPADQLRMEVKTSNHKGPVHKRVVGDRTAIVELGGLAGNASYEFTASWPAGIMDLSGPGFASGVGTSNQEGADEGLGSWRFERFDVDIFLHPDATLTVRETQVVRFRGAFTYLTRDIPAQVTSPGEGRTYGRVRLRDFSVYDLEGNPLNPGSWKVEDVNGGKRVCLFFQATDETRGWIIEYRVSGAVFFASERDRLYWNAVSRLREANILSSRVSLRLPEGLDPEAVETDMHVDPYAPPREWSLGKGGGLLWWEATDVSPFTTFILDASLPKGALKVPWPYRSLTGMVSIASGATILVGTLAVMLAMWWRKKRATRGQRRREIRRDPPVGLPPAMVGMLVRQRSRPEDLYSTIVDLARRGYLNILEEERRSIIRRRVVGFQRIPKDDSGLLPYERLLLESLFETGERVTEEDLEERFAAHLRDLLDGIKRDSVARGLFTRDPAKIRRTYAYLGWGAVALSLALLLALPLWLDLGWLTVPVLAPAAAGVAIWGLGWAVPRRTLAGSRIYGEVLGFRDHLLDPERPYPAEVARERFERDLPYALALGIAEHWAQKLEGMNVGLPSWIHIMDPVGEPAALIRALERMGKDLSRILTSRSRSHPGKTPAT
ncbi:MAG: DUF2207 domain-containing protein [Actinomycetota bacterium]